MAQPFLDLRDVGPVFEGVSGCRRSERVGAKGLDADADGFRVVHHHVPVHRIAGQGFLQVSIGSSHRPEKGAFGVGTVPGGVEVVLDQGESFGMHGGVAELPTLAVDGKGHDSSALNEMLDLESAEFCPAQAVVEENGENGAVPFALERGGVRGG